MTKTTFEELEPDEAEATFAARYADNVPKIDEHIVETLREAADDWRKAGIAPERAEPHLRKLAEAMAAQREVTLRKLRVLWKRDMGSLH